MIQDLACKPTRSQPEDNNQNNNEYLSGGAFSPSRCRPHINRDERHNRFSRYNVWALLLIQMIHRLLRNPNRSYLYKGNVCAVRHTARSPLTVRCQFEQLECSVTSFAQTD